MEYIWPRRLDVKLDFAFLKITNKLQYLHSRWADDVKGTNNAEDKLEHFAKTIISDTPGAIDEENHICLCSFAYWEHKNNSMSCSTQEQLLFLIKLLHKSGKRVKKSP